MLNRLKRALLACLGALALAHPAAAQTSAADALITDYYRSIIGRDPDASGLAFWRGQAELIQTLGGDVTETWRSLGISFFGSAEYRAGNPTDAEYVGDLYGAFFKRAPDAAGLAHWQGQLSAGMPREGVLLWFLFSPEFGEYMTSLFGDTHARAESHMVVDFYRGFLNRMPDENGFAYWVGRFRSAQCVGRQAVLAEVDAISRQFVGSAEYAGRGRTSADLVGDMYNAFLRRGPDLEGFLHWKSRVESGVDGDEMRRTFLASVEFQARVNAVVRQGCPTLAAASTLTPVVVDQSVSPFVAVIELRGLHADRISAVTFTVQPKPGAASRPVHANYTGSYLARIGYGPAARYGYRVSLFGLYANYANVVTLQATFPDGSTANVSAIVPTGAFTDPSATYDRPVVLKPRAAGSILEFDYFYVKSAITTPIVMDSDGEVRWWVPGGGTVSTLFERNGFTVGLGGMGLRRIELHGASYDVAIASTYTALHHNIDPGRTGILAEVDGIREGVPDVENDLIELAPDGHVIREWRFDEIISAHMRSRGDDPALFVRPGVDWFHMNAAAYDPRDDTIIASSRESFLIKVRYGTGEILWILGDPTKYWYTFPSLRERAITLVPAGPYPIGQHAVSVLPSGEVMVFNNGAASLQNPPGTSAGESRTYSEVTVYAINPNTMTGRVTRSFDYDRTILSSFCSSAYAVGASILATYSRADDGAKVRFVGVGGDSHPVFDLEVVNAGGCNTGWNAAPLPFEAMYFY